MGAHSYALQPTLEQYNRKFMRNLKLATILFEAGQSSNNELDPDYG
jgi:hypothetical protein